MGFVAFLILLTVLGLLAINKKSNRQNNSKGIDHLIDGYEFYADASIRTPLSVLKIRGRKFSSKDEVERLGGGSGFAVPILKRRRNKSIEKHGSDIGQFTGNQSLEKYYQFLELIRGIYEDDSLTAEVRYKKLKSLRDSPGKYAEYSEKLDEEYSSFPDYLFRSVLAKVHGIGKVTAQPLVDEGILTLQQLKNAPDNRLLTIKGLGKKGLEKIRAYLEENEIPQSTADHGYLDPNA